MRPTHGLCSRISLAASLSGNADLQSRQQSSCCAAVYTAQFRLHRPFRPTIRSTLFAVPTLMEPIFRSRLAQTPLRPGRFFLSPQHQALAQVPMFMVVYFTPECRTRHGSRRSLGRPRLTGSTGAISAAGPANSASRHQQYSPWVPRIADFKRRKWPSCCLWHRNSWRHLSIRRWQRCLLRSLYSSRLPSMDGDGISRECACLSNASE